MLSIYSWTFFKSGGTKAPFLARWKSDSLLEVFASRKNSLSMIPSLLIAYWTVRTAGVVKEPLASTNERRSSGSILAVPHRWYESVSRIFKHSSSSISQKRASKRCRKIPCEHVTRKWKVLSDRWTDSRFAVTVQNSGSRKTYAFTWGGESSSAASFWTLWPESLSENFS